MSQGRKIITNLAEMLALERIEHNIYRGHAPADGFSRLFGGCVVAQALLAAYDTVDEQVCHSLHSYFIHPGDPQKPVLFEVDRARDGGSFATRRVIALQDGRQILNLAASFQKPADGFEHQMAFDPAIPMPEMLIDDDLRGEHMGLQLRNISVPRPGMVAEERPPYHQMWFRSAWPLGPEIRHHQAALAYASDYPMLPVMVQPHPVTWKTPGFQFASLDHSLWFHRPFDFTRWHLCAMDTPSTSGGRGLGRGTIYAQDGTLVASVAQEGMLRMRQ
ncbi:acyl-CoA thioesterase II [Sphingobium sp. Sx8-8]|uniref:acyl-CoA thioesterase n=1 Tax=Sphingobium sp. Sx8-8 TaxID=2933617 RepID=UPI001F571374|nr:acyl-CoA thioesterase II [Sphingobium sp. Sx8-8]